METTAKYYGPETDCLKQLMEVQSVEWTIRISEFLRQRKQKEINPETDTVGPLTGGPVVKAEFEVSIHSSSVERLDNQYGHGKRKSKMHQQPTAPRERFSSLTGPEVWYDGEGQQFLTKLWDDVGKTRGAFRKELMSLRKMMPAEKALYRPLLTLIEQTDAILDKAVNAVEDAAFIMLKGDKYRNHLAFVIQRFKEVKNLLATSNLTEPAKRKTTSFSMPAFDDTDVDATLEADDGDGPIDADDGDIEVELSLPPKLTFRSARAPPTSFRQHPSRITRMRRPVIDDEAPIQADDAPLEADDKIEADDAIEADDGDGDVDMKDYKVILPPRRVAGVRRAYPGV